MLLPHGVPRRHMSNRRSGGSSSGYSKLVLMIIAAVPSFFLGLLGSMSSILMGGACSNNNNLLNSNNGGVQQQIDRLVQEKIQGSLDTLCQAHAGRALENQAEHAAAAQQSADLLPSTAVGRYATAISRVPKSEFTAQYDLGVPLDKANAAGAEDILVLYSNAKAMPASFGDDTNTIPALSMPDAVENCEYLNVVLTDHGNRKQCIAIVPQYESYHVQKWMRIDEMGKLDGNSELQMVSRGLQSNGQEQFAPPDLERNTRKHWKMLQNYFNNVDDVLAELKPILERIAVRNTVIVMVCNFGQSELLINFVCAARNRGFDTSNIVVFTTDQETTDLAEAMGLTTYYDKRNFGDLPAEAARRYGDARFTAMMMAKVICVQLVSMLGYDFLFQDVDIVWYKNPLDYFHDETLPAYKYDAFFQDDGGHSIRYAPYSANSGFYFVRYNERTRHFLTSLLMAGDLILSTDSHQQALIATLNEHVSLYGLKAKVLSRDMEEFPGGYQFHQHSGNYMRAMFKGELKPYIFHMSWTLNKNNKLKFFRQMGEWYVKDECIATKLDDIGDNNSNLPATCCAAEPIVRMLLPRQTECQTLQRQPTN